VKPCADAREFAAHPVGRCISGESWLYFYPRDELCGFLLWGEPSETDMQRLVHVLAVELGRSSHVALVDARRVVNAAPGAFAVLEAYVRENAESLGRAVLRLALVRPEGMPGAVTAGFFGVAPQPYPVNVFDDRASALAWLGGSDLEDVIASEEARATGTPPLLRDLRALLEGRLTRDPSLEPIARALGIAERSLQRKLAEHGTTFQGEVNQARVRVAKRLLAETDAKLTHVASEVGCASLPSFSGLFRRATGETPSGYRARARAKGRA
jgi:AraC-like DNA-binding protein